MLDRLIDIILQFTDSIKPWEVIEYYNRGVRLRFGKPYPNEKHVLEQGLHWKIPFVDEILSIMVKTTTMRLPEQTITTKDNTVVVVKAVIKYEIDDAAMVLLEVNDPIDAVADMTQGIIRDKIIGMNYIDVNNDGVDKDITVSARREASKWGIKIRSVTLTDFGRMTSIRLLNTQVPTEFK